MRWAVLLLTILSLPLIFNAKPLEILRLKTFDAFIETPEPTGYFTTLNITDEDVQREGGYPFPRQRLAEIQYELLDKGAIGVGWVMLFPEPDRFGGDEEFSIALQSLPSVIGMPEVDNGIYPETHGTVIVGEDVNLPKAKGFLENTPVLKDSATQGVLTAPIDVDGLVRQIPLLQQTEGGWVASFGTQVLKILGGGQTYQIRTNINGIEQIRVKGLPPISTDSLGRKWISWVDTPQTTLEEMNVQDTFVFVGVTAKGIMPQLSTPVGLLEPHKIQVALAESILMESPKIPDYRLVLELSLFAISGLLVALVINFLGVTIGMASALGLIVLTGFGGAYTIQSNLLIDVTWSMISMILVSTQQFWLNFRIQFKLRQQIKKQFEHYLDPRQVKQLQDDPSLLRLGGEKRYCTFLFTDVRGFTALSEKLEPQEVTEIMNKALTIQSSIVQDLGGMVDKYIGDAMMAIFNAPLDLTDHENRAILAGQQMLQKIKEADLGVEIGVGISSGDAIIGNMGSDTRFDYTAIGDAVNTGARLESATKNVGINLLISEATAKHSTIKTTFIKEINVKGKSKSLKVYTTP
tara:strand:- start:11690 stop:13423 length:1734 start_codon:yes stop_codon:yes gene_type:complete